MPAHTNDANDAHDAHAKPPVPPAHETSPPEWFIQYCLYGPQQGKVAVMHADQAITANRSEAGKRVPMNYWITIGRAPTEREAKALRVSLRRACMARI